MTMMVGKDYDKIIMGEPLSAEEWKWFYDLSQQNGMGFTFTRFRGHKNIYFKKGEEIAIEFCFSDMPGFGKRIIDGTSFDARDEASRKIPGNIQNFIRFCCKDYGVVRSSDLAMFTTIALPIKTWKQELETLTQLVTQ